LGSLAGFFRQQSLWKAENYAKTSGNATLLQQRANSSELIGQGPGDEELGAQNRRRDLLPRPHLPRRSHPGDRKRS